MPTYEYWQNALAGNFGAVHEGDAQPGFYRKRVSRGGPFVPVAIWEQDGKVIATVDGKPTAADDVWTYACQHPISEEVFRARADGKPWPDEDASVTQSLAPPPAGMGDNAPPTDPAEILKGQIEAASAGAARYAEITDDETADAAQSLRARLNELSGEADKAREKAKKPHLEAGKEIDAKWQPLVKAAKGAADAIKAALGAHETRKARAAAEAQRVADEARRAAEKAAADALEAGKPPPAIVPPAPAPEPAPEPAATIRGAYGRAASVKVVKVAKVVDQDAAYGGLRKHPEMVALIATLAQRATTAGVEVPGVEVTEERRVA